MLGWQKNCSLMQVTDGVGFVLIFPVWKLGLALTLTRSEVDK